MARRYNIGMGGLRRLAGIVAIAAVLATALVSGSAAADQKSIAASEGWVKLPGAGDTSATAYVVIDNPTMYDIYIVSAASDAAADVEFRQKTAAADATAQSVKEIAASAYTKLELTTDGAHLILRNLKRALREGEIVTLTFTTDGGLVLQAPAVVRKP
jgi:copper(I)-binding protein